MRGVIKYFLTFVLVCVLIVIGLVAYMTIWGIPATIVHKVSDYLGSNYGIEIEVGEARMEWFQGVVLDDLNLGYQVEGSDLSINGSSISIGLDWDKLLNKKPPLKYLLFRHVRAEVQPAPEISPGTSYKFDANAVKIYWPSLDRIEIRRFDLEGLGVHFQVAGKVVGLRDFIRVSKKKIKLPSVTAVLAELDGPLKLIKSLKSEVAPILKVNFIVDLLAPKRNKLKMSLLF